MWMVLREKNEVVNSVCETCHQLKPAGKIVKGWEIFRICATQEQAGDLEKVSKAETFHKVKVVEIPEYDLGL